MPEQILILLSVGAYQPSVTASEGTNVHTKHFIGTSSYMYPWEILLLNSTATLEAYAAQAKVVCAMTYAQVVQYSIQHGLGIEDKFLATATQDFCFIVSYVYLLLTEGYGFPKNQTFTVLTEINGNSVGWAFGAMMYEINTMPWQYDPVFSMLKSYITLFIAGKYEILSAPGTLRDVDTAVYESLCRYCIRWHCDCPSRSPVQ
jgi:hypothetical protein